MSSGVLLVADASVCDVRVTSLQITKDLKKMIVV